MVMTLLARQVSCLGESFGADVVGLLLEAGVQRA